ncbi:MAG TPA: class E sortase [Acidimicrobiales bacterium]|nr:class E sortase [Acidimicrobiales bacterium]
MRLAKALNAIGRTCITVGVLILLFVAYQLWGTGIREAQAQNRLEREFKAKQGLVGGTSSDVVGASTTATTAPRTTDTVPPVTVPPTAPLAEGEALGRIQIPRISLDAIVVEGVGDDDLKSGPGHYPSTPAPGQKGNAAIAGHRTTYGAPFGSVDELAPGDPITVTTLQGTFTYKVMPQQDGSGHIIVNPNQTEVLNEIPGKNTLTLTACHPKYSASQRIIVFAELQGDPKPAPPRPADVPAPKLNDESLSGKKAPKLPAILFGLLCAAIWVTAWQLGNRWRKWPAYAVGLPFFLIALFYFFENFSRLLPSNY